MASPPAPELPPSRLSRLFSAIGRGFVAYARWLDGISWKRFFLLSLLALIVTGIVSNLPPFDIPWGTDRLEERPAARRPGESASDAAARRKAIVVEGRDRGGKSYSISIDADGVHVRRVKPAAASAASAPASAASAAPAASAPSAANLSVAPDIDIRISLPRDADRDEIERAIEAAEEEIERAVEQAAADVEEAIVDVGPSMRRVRAFRPGDHMPGFMVALIFVSMIIKIMAAGRFRAEAQAVQAQRTAEDETLKRQVVEARMAAMQAQVEPHFLFNTLASIDHLIETDPPRASQMQKHLIALLRAAMPTMREANAQGRRELGRELEVIRPYLEILKIRMGERLRTELRVPEGLLSADFPPMMLQALVENAIKHGLEPKPEGGTLTVSAEVVHGKLAVTVADTGLGFGKAPTTGTGIGLDNIRERLKLLYAGKASLTVAENPGGGTAVTITVPYAASNGAPGG